MACNRLRAFTGGGGLPFSCVTPVFIEHFASSLRHEGLAVNSVNSYLSCFRAIYNAAVREELFVPERNPFRFLRLRRELTAKRALPLSSLQEACRLEIGGSELSHSLDFYLFSFLSCGMPFVDMAHLTRENIVGNGGFQAACACFGHQPGFGPYVGEDHAYLPGPVGAE